MTVIRAPDDRYYASFVVDVAQMPLPQTGNDVGIDLGLTSLLDVEDQAGCSVAVLTAVLGLVSSLVAGMFAGVTRLVWKYLIAHLGTLQILWVVSVRSFS